MTGSLGIPPRNFAEDMLKASRPEWSGIKVEIEAAVINRKATFKIIPSAAPQIIKSLEEEKVDRRKVKSVKHKGNLDFEDVVKIAQKMRDAKKSMAANLQGTVKEILGTCLSIGCTVDNKSPKEIT